MVSLQLSFEIATLVVFSGTIFEEIFYLGIVLELIGLAIALDSLWLLLTLVPFVLVIRYGVLACKEAYLRRKFGDVHRRYSVRVRRWL
jgi:protein-S-isoprenylcysteine O-methyltransferase Ste14